MTEDDSPLDDLRRQVVDERTFHDQRLERAFRRIVLEGLHSVSSGSPFDVGPGFPDDLDGTLDESCYECGRTDVELVAVEANDGRMRSRSLHADCLDDYADRIDGDYAAVREVITAAEARQRRD